MSNEELHVGSNQERNASKAVIVKIVKTHRKKPLEVIEQFLGTCENLANI